ncbi:MAG: arylesterase [Chitinophagaceae bacterium]|nr:arylesterase [Chitinophagaceae bacterium]
MFKIIRHLAMFSLTGFAFSCGQDTRSPEKKEAGTQDTTAVSRSVKTIVFFGNSLTAGYGLEPSQAFPAVIQQKLDSLNLPYKVVNAGVSGETSSGGNGRIDWILEQPVDIFVLELGANDGLRGIPIAETKTNLQAIVDKVMSKNPQTKIIIAGMQMPPNMGLQYTADFRSIFAELAKNNNCTLIPFILDGVGGEVNLNQEDGIHPTAEGHRIVAENVWKEMRGVL